MSIEKAKTIEGTKWTLIIYISSLIVTFGITIFLGRISPELVGYYSLVTIFIQTVIAFFLFGGQTVLPTLLPKIKSNVKRNSFVLSYFILVFIFVSIGMIIFFFYPELFEKLTSQNFDDEIKTTLVFLIPLIFFVQFISWFLNATFELKWSSFVEKLNIFIIFILLLLSWLFVVDTIYIDSFLENIIYFFILSFIVSIIVSYRKIKNTITKTKVKLFYFPKGFWNFAITAQFMTFLAYFFNNFDKVIVLQISNIEELGKYTVVIMIWQLTRYLPQVLSKALIPYLSKNIHQNNIPEVVNYYKFVNRITVLLSTFIIMFVLMFSDLILGIFGKSFLDMNNILVLLVGGSVFLTLSYTITPMMIAYEFNKIRLLNSLAQIFIQVVVTMILINYFQILGIVLGLLLSVIIAQIFPIYKIYKVLGSHVKVISVEFVKSVFFISLITVITLTNTNVLIDIITFVILIVAFFFIFKISKEELYQIKKLLRENKNA